NKRKAPDMGYNAVLSNQKKRQKNPFGFMTSLEGQFLEVPKNKNSIMQTMRILSPGLKIRTV
ncbi:MAG: hypothetical protein LBO77_05135, partial [Desulfovibrio sp.]|nr:hypothetical protein [Desulfovibrio sp.]